MIKDSLISCKKTAEKGDVSAQLLLGMKYGAVGQGIDEYKQGVYWYRKAAEQGSAEGQHELGFMYEKGQDYKQAVYWYRKAAEQGHTTAQSYLAILYARGQGVSQDFVMAHMLWNIVANGNEKAVEDQDNITKQSGHSEVQKAHAAQNRNNIAKQMTPSQIEKAQDLAKKWVAMH